MESPDKSRSVVVKRRNGRRRHNAGNTPGLDEQCPPHLTPLISLDDGIICISNITSDKDPNAEDSLVRKRRRRQYILNKTTAKDDYGSNEIFYSSSEDEWTGSWSPKESSSTTIRTSEHFSVIFYNKVRGSLPPRPKGKKEKVQESATNSNIANQGLVSISPAVAACQQRTINQLLSTKAEVDQRIIAFNAKVDAGALTTYDRAVILEMYMKVTNLRQSCQNPPDVRVLLPDLNILFESLLRLCSRAGFHL